MKQKIDRYKRGRSIQQMMLAAIGGLLILAGTKAVYLIEKVHLVQTGLEFYINKQWIEAEESLQEAARHRGFDYKKKEMQGSLSELEWITQYKSTLETLYETIEISKENKDYEGFKRAVATYENLGFHGLTQEKQAYLLNRYPMEEAVSLAWVSFKGYMQNLLSYPTDAAEYNWAKDKISEIPEAYFASEKDVAILKLFKMCDTRVYEGIILSNNTLESALMAFNQIYDTNQKYGYKTEWLEEPIKGWIKERFQAVTQPIEQAKFEALEKTPKVYTLEAAPIVLPILSEIEKQIIEVVATYKAYDTYAHQAYQDDRIKQVIESFLKNKEKEISFLISAHYYEEAVTVYEALKDLKNYEADIERVHQLKVYEEPLRVLTQHEDSYEGYQVGENALGGSKYVLALTKSGRTLELYRLIGTAEAYEIQEIKIPLQQLGLENLEVNPLEAVSVSEDLILFKQIEEERESIKVLQVAADEMVLIFEGVGEQMIISSDLKRIEVIDSAESLEPMIYNYDGVVYVKEEEDPLTSSDLMDYIEGIIGGLWQ